MKKIIILSFLFIFLIPLISFASYFKNPYTNELDYYQSSTETGNVLGPGTNHNGYIPVWTGVNSKILADGIINNSSNWNTAYGWGNHASAGYLTSYTETDPIVKAINGIVKSNGSTISAASEGTDYLAGTRIDDTKGNGDTTYVWSADKSFDQLALKLDSNFLSIGSLADPNADTLIGWDDTDGAIKFFTVGANLSYDHATHTLSATGGGGETLAETLAIGADANDVSVTSLAKLEGFDNAVYVDMSANGNVDVVADTNIDLNSPVITFANATKPLQSIFLSAGGATIPTSSYAEINDFAGTNFPYRVLAFDQSADEKCYWPFVIPDNFTGSTVTITVYWTAKTGTATRGVSWKFDSGGFANDEAFDTGALGGTEIEVEDALIATGDIHMATSAAFTCDWTAGDWATLYCYRDVDAYSGTNLDADALLLGIKIEYSIGTLGQ